MLRWIATARRFSTTDMSPIQMRVHIYKATVSLALTYNIGTWPSLTKGDARSWSGGVFRLYRRLLLRHFSEGRAVPHDWKDAFFLPHPEELLHFHRLSHYALCARRHNQQFWALAGLDNDWLQTVRNAVQWMYRQVEGFTVLPEPCTDQALQEWHDFMISDPKKFSSTLKRAQYHAILQRAVHSDVHTFHCNILDLLQKGGLVIHNLLLQHR